MPGPVFGWGVFGFICPKPFVWLGGILLDFQGHVLARMIFFNHPRPCTFRCSWLGCVPFRLPKAICVARVIFVKFQDHVLVRVILFNHPRPCTFRYVKPFVWLGLSVFIKSSKTMCWLGWSSLIILDHALARMIFAFLARMIFAFLVRWHIDPGTEKCALKESMRQRAERACSACVPQRSCMHESRPTGTFGFPTTCPDLLRRNEVKGLGFVKLCLSQYLVRVFSVSFSHSCG